MVTRTRKFDHMTPDPTGDPLRSSSQYPLSTPKARLKTYGERTFPLFDLRMKQKNSCPGKELAWKRELIKMTCVI